MFDPASLEVVNDSSRPQSYFVGIRKRPSSDAEFCLPIGFDKFPTDDQSRVRNLFFSIYRTLTTFQKNLSNRIRNYHKKEKDTGYTSQDGASFETKEGEEVTLYSKIPMLESILDSYDELRIFRIIRRPTHTEDIDYSKIHKYLENAIFLKNDTPYVSDMKLPKKTLSYSEASIVRMFCFIYREIKKGLSQDNEIKNEIAAQAALFKHNHLNPDSLLFGEAHERTIKLLKNVLYEIGREVDYKSRDYWYFHDAIEIFLYGSLKPNENGLSWGISTFSPVWEDMCLTYVFEEDPDQIKYADVDRSRYINDSLGNHALYLDDQFESPFYLERDNKRRHMRPDVVRGGKTPEDKFNNLFEVTWVDEQTPHIRTQDTPKGKSMFEKLADYLTISGERFSPGTTSHKFSYAPKPRFESQKSRFMSNYLSAESVDYKVYDFKYVSHVSYTSPNLSKKCERDVKKQIVYEYALQLNRGCNTSSHLQVPYYFEDNPKGIVEEIKNERVNDKLSNQNIGLCLIDFEKVREVYVNTYK